MWVHAKKIGDGLEVYISEDSFDWMQIRQGDITDDSILQIGLYAASPRSDEGIDATFEDFMIKGEDNWCERSKWNQIVNGSQKISKAYSEKLPEPCFSYYLLDSRIIPSTTPRKNLSFVSAYATYTKEVTS